MALFTFSGGVHPDDGKNYAKNAPITEYLPKGDVVLPVGQHIGAPAKPIVSKGDHVLAGQKVAEAGGFVSANIFSSVSGTVKAVEPRVTPAGAKVNAIVIENDGEYKEVEYHAKSYDSMSKEEVLEAIREAGIVGLGGAGFPTHVKLAPKNPEAIEYIIVNGAECEPYITGDYRMMMEMPEKIIEGLNIVLDLFPKAKGIIGIEDNKKDAIAKMEAAVKGDARISVASLKTKYPQGAERSLIYATTGRSINSSMLPADAGCIVDNVATIAAIKDAVKDGKPLFTRVVTVTGDAVAKPGNFLVRTGTNVNELIEAAGGFKNQPEKVISGGPMMGMAMYTTDVPAVKTFSCLLAMTKDEVSANAPSNCIRCGRCVSVCPQKLVPMKLSVLADHGEFDEFEKLHGAECVECGSCSYICPAKRNLAQSMKTGRKQVLANRRKK
nr:electron transport complex subunit RsxC [uncultured Anaerostipes sp.]